MEQLRNKIIGGLITLFFVSSVSAQCTRENTAFQSGENLQYDLYFKYGPIYKKAGNGSLKTVNAKFKGKDAYRMDLVTASTGAIRKIFALNDTLTSYMSRELTPLAYFKNAHEDGDHTKESLYYTYADNKVSISTTRFKNGVKKFSENLTVSQCTYDMLSVVFFARTLDFSTMAKGKKTRISFISGKKHQNMDIVYEGTETMKANDNNNYNCHKVSLVTSDDAFENKKEAMKVYITADANKIPIRIDSGLKVGSIRIILKSYKGLRN